eukprot:CAMPEP_0185773174 /NCGR_PEP_ID=MMETSP1174-20130828/72350_1 /TAXON_ID=35687 /ORGANISM="Dictyocha speculum, Strain CCMP1381" /LENGTH=79 /DNA_ID=CAMNT_0028459741 /DNA_START=190 /DNA_END=429 /DNA_ORIENTATION=+
MYTKSLDASLQGKAIIRAEALWGVGGVAVCKRKFHPLKTHIGGAVEKRYACYLHHDIRRKRIDRYGLRSGWEDFKKWHG